MFGSYTEVVAYGHDDDEQNTPTTSTQEIEELEHHVICAAIIPSRNSFGGFRTWPVDRHDFVLIAECSELFGPNPLFTIPLQEHSVIDLKALSIRILSTDYQELGNGQSIPIKNTQLLMPDIMNDVHAVVNHFIIFDSEARGFVRPVCLAYITSNKHKLIKLAEPLLKNLAQASLCIQQTNRKLLVKELENLLLDLEFTKNVISSECYAAAEMHIQECSVQQHKKSKVDLIESSLKDVHHVLNCVQSIQEKYNADKAISSLLQRAKDYLLPETTDVINNFLAISNQTPVYQAQMVKIPVQQNFKKNLRPLMLISPGGMLLGLYHLYIMHKHFQRKYENIILQQEDQDYGDDCLYFGACIRQCLRSDTCYPENKCCMAIPDTPSCFHLESNDYFYHVDADFWLIATELDKRQDKVPNSENKSCSTVSNMRIFKGDFRELSSHCDPDTRISLNVDGNQILESENDDSKPYSKCQWHTTTLSTIWNVLDSLYANNIEAVFHEILQRFHQTESILFSLLTGSMIVVVGPIDYSLQIQHFVKVLGALSPRTRKNVVWVEPNRRKSLEKQDLVNVAAVGFCIVDGMTIKDLIPLDLMPFITVIDLKNSSFSGIKYTGCLLSDAEKKLKALPVGGPIFPVLISILAEVEMHVHLWKSVVASSISNSIATRYLLQKGFTSCDIQIVQKLARLCGQ